MADREGDIHEIFAERERIVQRGEIAADWLIRAKHDRKTDQGEDPRPAFKGTASRGDANSPLHKGRGNRKARPVTQTLRAISVVLSPTEKGLAPGTVTALLA